MEEWPMVSRYIIRDNIQENPLVFQHLFDFIVVHQDVFDNGVDLSQKLVCFVVFHMSPWFSKIVFQFVQYATQEFQTRLICGFFKRISRQTVFTRASSTNGCRHCVCLDHNEGDRSRKQKDVSCLPYLEGCLAGIFKVTIIFDFSYIFFHQPCSM